MELNQAHPNQVELTECMFQNVKSYFCMCLTCCHRNCLPLVEYPSCPHTTAASLLSQESSHTVPHCLFMQISTLPSFGMLPPTSLRPVEHGAMCKSFDKPESYHVQISTLSCSQLQNTPSQPTPASAEWRQLCDSIGLLGHSSSLLALEVH